MIVAIFIEIPFMFYYLYDCYLELANKTINLSGSKGGCYQAHLIYTTSTQTQFSTKGDAGKIFSFWLYYCLLKISCLDTM